MGDTNAIYIAEIEGFSEEKIVAAKRARLDWLMKQGIGLEAVYSDAKEFGFTEEQEKALEGIIAYDIKGRYLPSSTLEHIKETGLDAMKVVSALKKGIVNQENEEEPIKVYETYLNLKKKDVYSEYYPLLKDDAIEFVSRYLKKILKSRKNAISDWQKKDDESEIKHILNEFPEAIKGNESEIKYYAKEKMKEEMYGSALYYAKLIEDKDLIKDAAEKRAEDGLKNLSDTYLAKKIYDTYPVTRPFIRKIYEETFKKLTKGKDKNIHKAIDLTIAFQDDRYDSLVEQRLKEEIACGNIEAAKSSVDHYHFLLQYKGQVYKLYEIMKKDL